MNNLVNHHIVNGRDDTPRPGQLYSYYLCGNGVFVGARREGMEVCFPISRCEVRGLAPLDPFFVFGYPRVSEEVMRSILIHAQREAEDNLEQLYHLVFDGTDKRFRLVIPPQKQSSVRCELLEDGEGTSLAEAVIEIHSHHQMPARFSPIDDADERGFRLYGVIGHVLDEPEINFRVGLHGMFWPIPAEWVCELPSEIEDRNE